MRAQSPLRIDPFPPFISVFAFENSNMQNELLRLLFIGHDFYFRAITLYARSFLVSDVLAARSIKPRRA